jgi:hypothetical protein
MWPPLLRWTEHEIKKVPEEPGVYVVYYYARPYYVGRASRNIRGRLWAHFRGKKKGSVMVRKAARYAPAELFRFRYWLVPAGDVAGLEAVLIEALGGIDFGNLRREKLPQDWETLLRDWEYSVPDGRFLTGPFPHSDMTH